MVPVVERNINELGCPNLRVVLGHASALHIADKAIALKDGRRISYGKLCICTGACPKVGCLHAHVAVTGCSFDTKVPPSDLRASTQMLNGFADSCRVNSVRDWESIDKLAAQLPSARRIVLIGNGGIALELVQVLRDVEVRPTCESCRISGRDCHTAVRLLLHCLKVQALRQVIWVMRHVAIGDAFFDRDAAEYLLQQIPSAGPADVPASDTDKQVDCYYHEHVIVVENCCLHLGHLHEPSFMHSPGLQVAYRG